MGDFSEFLLVAGGALGITFIIQWIAVPFFFGIPFVLYWTFRRYLKWRTPFLYSSKPVFYMVVAFVVASLLLSFFPKFIVSFISNFWFGSGVLMGLSLWLGRIMIFRSVRSEIHFDLVHCVKAHVTPKGRIALLALLSRW
jgi:hypothetical protein